MKAIVAVYHKDEDSEWGIGRDGTQPLVLNADRKFFRITTFGATVIVGYKTMLDFPNSEPLNGRRNIILTRKEIPGLEIVHSIEELNFEELKDAFVIGGASVYNQLFPYCDEVFVTHIYEDISPDVYFPKLNNSQNWETEILQSGIENNIPYKIIKYTKINK